MGSYIMTTPKLYAKEPPSSSIRDDVCTAKQQTSNVCSPEENTYTSNYVSTAEEQTAMHALMIHPI
jgi:hypothetical protein